MSERTFNINSVLKQVFANLEDFSRKKGVELIYEMGSTVPKELRGDEEKLENFLTGILGFFIESTSKKEIVLSLSAPVDFVYEESVLFDIKNSEVPYPKLSALLDGPLGNELEALEGRIVDPAAIDYTAIDYRVDCRIDIPFRINELGFRRHYRLTDKSMLDKKVIIILDSKNVSRSIQKLFEYFHYKVTASKTEEGIDLLEYDILLTEDKSVTTHFKDKIIEAYSNGLKCVWIGEPRIMGEYKYIVAAHIKKPIIQESIWALIELLFNYEMVNNTYKDLISKEVVPNKHRLLSAQDHSNDFRLNHNSSLNFQIESINARESMTLDVKSGDEYCKSIGLSYKGELKKFLQTFDRSDIYFREIVNNKDIVNIEKFCEDSIKHAEKIGAEDIHKVMEMVQLVLQHKQYDMLPIYPGKYHIELRKLKEKINYFLRG